MNSSSSGTTSTSLVSPSGSLSPLPQPSSSSSVAAAEARARSIKESIAIEAKQALASMKDGTDTSCLHPVCCLNDDDSQ